MHQIICLKSSCFAMSMQVVYILAISLFRHLLQLLTVGLHNCLDNCVQELQHINGVVDFIIIIIARPRTASINAIYKSKYIATAN